MYYQDHSKTWGLDYLLKAEKGFQEYYEDKHKDFIDAQGDIDMIKVMNQYCYQRGANWKTVTLLQTKLLLEL